MLLHGGVDRNFGVPALVGSTSPVHLALVAGIGLLFPLPWAMHIALWAAAALYGFGLHRLARMAGAAPAAAVVFAAAGLLAGRTPHQMMNGLETGLAMAAAAWALALAAEPAPRRGHALALGALCGLLPFIRPEFAVLSAVLFCLLAYRLRSMRLTAEALAMALVAAVPWIAWSWIATGSPVPATIDAKRAWFAEAGLPLGLKARAVFIQMTQFAAFFGIIAIAAAFTLGRTAVGRAGLLFWLAMAGAYTMNLPGSLTHYEQRYLYVLAPVLLFGAAKLMQTGLPLPSAPAGRPMLLSLLFLVQPVIMAPSFWNEHERGIEFTRSELAGVAEWSKANLPANAKLLIHDAGYIAWATPFTMSDMVGLKTPTSVRDNMELTLPSAGRRRGEAISRIAARNGATHLVVLDEWDRIFGITDGLREQGWKLVPRRTEGAYDVYSLLEGNGAETAPPE